MDIKFTFSGQFNASLTEREVLYPAKEIEAMDSFWKTQGKEIEEILNKITGLSFVEQSIKCYINPKLSISDPFCIKIEDIEDMKDSLVHELIHILYLQDDEKVDKAWRAFVEVYKNESPTTRIHILVHRVHYLVAQRLFPDRLERIMNFSKRSDYIRSWKILKNTEKVDKLFELKT